MENPFRPEHFQRVDTDDDRRFYTMPRLVRHIDDAACAALARFLGDTLPEGGVILDLMSSYASHLPDPVPYAAIIGLGMNQAELSANPQLSAGIIHDLNDRPELPFRDACFDGCSLAVSVQYLTRPIELFRDLGRVLKPGAPAVISFSNRMFPTKATAIWRSLSDDDHAVLIGQYFRISDMFDPAEAADLGADSGNQAGTGGDGIQRPDLRGVRAAQGLSGLLL